MAINFDVEVTKFPDNVSDSTTAAAIEAWLDGLVITTLYNLTILHAGGFYVCIVTYA